MLVWVEPTACVVYVGYGLARSLVNSSSESPPRSRDRHSVLGRPIEAVHFVPPGYAKPRPAAVLFGAIHGDEPASQLMLERLADELVERPPGRDTWIVPCLNVDGLAAGTRDNATRRRSQPQLRVEELGRRAAAGVSPRRRAPKISPRRARSSS